MIRITVELLPFGHEALKSTLATARIWNDGSGSPFLASYGFKLHGKSGYLMRAGMIGEYRSRDFSVWWLIAGILRAAFPEVEQRAFRDKRIVAKVRKS
jgi:hypothetical protein